MSGNDEAERKEKVIQSSQAHIGQLLKMVSPLKDQQFHEWDRQVRSGAYLYGWPDHILDKDTPRPAEADLTLKNKCEEKNAYVIITKTADTHAKAAMLASVPMGDAKAAYNMVVSWTQRAAV